MGDAVSRRRDTARVRRGRRARVPAVTPFRVALMRADNVLRRCPAVMSARQYAQGAVATGWAARDSIGSAAPRVLSAVVGLSCFVLFRGRTWLQPCSGLRGFSVRPLLIAHNSGRRYRTLRLHSSACAALIHIRSERGRQGRAGEGASLSSGSPAGLLAFVFVSVVAYQPSMAIANERMCMRIAVPLMRDTAGLNMSLA